MRNIRPIRKDYEDVVLEDIANNNYYTDGYKVNNLSREDKFGWRYNSWETHSNANNEIYIEHKLNQEIEKRSHMNAQKWLKNNVPRQVSPDLVDKLENILTNYRNYKSEYTSSESEYTSYELVEKIIDKCNFCIDHDDLGSICIEDEFEEIKNYAEKLKDILE